MIDGHDPADDCCAVSRRLALEHRARARRAEDACCRSEAVEHRRRVLLGPPWRYRGNGHRSEGSMGMMQGKGLVACWVVLGDFGGTPGVAGGMGFSTREKALEAVRCWAIPNPQVQQVLLQLDHGRVIDPAWLDTQQGRPVATLRLQEND